MSKLLPCVLSARVPSAVAVHVYQVDADEPKFALTCAGSPASCVAATVVPVTAASEVRGVALEKLSFAGGVGPGAGGGCGAELSPVYRSRFGEPAPASVTTPVVAADPIVAATCAGVLSGLAERIRAASPATCGDAIEVPEIVLVAVVDVFHADVIPVPGAKTSTQLPKFEYEARASFDPVAPTVSAFGVDAGDEPQASALELPAATAKVMPSAIAFCVAVLSAAEYPPPRLMLATAGTPVTWLAVAQSMPEITPAIEPDPVQSSTRTATSET